MTQSFPCPVPVVTDTEFDPLELPALVTAELLLEFPGLPECTVTEEPPGTVVVLETPFCDGTRTVLDKP